jgi:cysteinyl-tRNA synthetase
MELRLHDTLTKEKRAFVPLDPNNVRMYVCGPTVYDFAHIGNARPVIVFDVLFRLLRHRYGEGHVTYVRNITDVDDKINDRAVRDFPGLPLNEAIRKVTEKTATQFHADVAALGCLPPTFEPRATDFVLPRPDGKADMVTLIKQLIARGHAYEAGGEVLFDTQSMADYGALSGRKLDEQLAGARVAVDAHKKNPADFVLWKQSSENEPGWESPWGRGRPGWHIECSAMSAAYLGDVFDIHGGGLDLIFPHHENEIAQSESATGKPFVKFWFHARFLLVEGEKMSKSLGNFFTLRDLVLKGHKPSSIRYLLTSVPYRHQLNFTFGGLQQAAASVERLRNFRQRLVTGKFPAGSDLNLTTLANDSSQCVREALNEDLNTAQAQAAIFDMVRVANAAIDSGEMKHDDVRPLVSTLDQFDEIFGVLKDDDAAKMQRVADWAKSEGREKDISPELMEALRSNALSDEQVNQKIEEMKAARAAKNFAASDAIRAELTANGILIEQTKEGVRWRRK